MRCFIYARFGLLAGSGSSGSTAGGTCELNCADNSVLCVDEFEAFEVDFTYLKCFAKAEVVNVDDETFGNGGVGSAHFHLLHGEGELTTGFYTFCVAFEFHGNFDDYGLVFLHFEKVDVEDGVFNGVELDVFEDSGALFAVDVEFYSENVGGVDQLADCFVGYYEVVIRPLPAASSIVTTFSPSRSVPV